MTKEVRLKTGVIVYYNEKEEIESVVTPHWRDTKKECKTISKIKTVLDYFKPLKDE
jgi:hypothetical protein